MQGPTLTLGLILLYTGLTGKPVETYKLYMMCVGADITNFTCTNGTVCAGDTVKCYCSTSSGTIQWNITSNQVSRPAEAIISISPNICDVEDKGYTFICYNEIQNTSQLSFMLNHSQTVHINCSDAQEPGYQITTITDAG